MGKVTYFNKPTEEKFDEEALKALEEKKRKEKLRNEIKKSITPWIIFGIMFFVGIGLLVYSGIRKEFRHNNWVATQAVVVNQEVSEKKENVNNQTEVKTYYHAVFQYTFDGVEYAIADKTGGTSPIYGVGDEVTIYVNPENPKDFESAASTRFFYFFGSIVLMLSFFALCVSTEPVLAAAFPKADWPQYVGHYLPFMVFVLTVDIISLFNIKPHSVLNIAALIVFIVAVIFTIFLAVIMLKEMIENAWLKKRVSKKVAQVEETLKGIEEFKQQHPELFNENSKNKDDN